MAGSYLQLVDELQSCFFICKSRSIKVVVAIAVRGCSIDATLMWDYLQSTEALSAFLENQSETN